MAEKARKGAKKGPAQPLPVAENPPGPGAVALVLDFLSRFSRFGWDVLGVVLLALALLTLLAAAGWTRGAAITPWVAFLRRWVGFGSWVFGFSAGALGLVALRKRSNQPARVSLGQVLALEGAAFTLLALLAIAGGQPLELVEAGDGWGGLVGWGLAELAGFIAGSPLREIILGVLLAVFLAAGLGWTARLNRWMDAKVAGAAAETGGQPAETAARTTRTGPVDEDNNDEQPPEPARTTRPKDKPGTRLPPEFRKSLKLETPADEKATRPRERDPRLPPLNLLIGEQSSRPDERHINMTAGLIEKTLSEFGVPAKVVGFRIGPTVTQFAVEPGFVEKAGPDGEMQRQKVRVSHISNLARDLALALSADRLRIEAPVPGRSYVGIEVPNSRSTLVRLRPILETDAFNRINSALAIALGRDVSGQPVVADLARMPHLLIAGTTGSGKSVCIAALTACLIANNTPEQLRIAMIDPKMVELVRFNGVPHLLGKVETDLERILAVLRWTLAEMDNRYRLLETARARDLDSYNRKMEKRGKPALPRIVVMIDELADLMMSAPDQTEHSLVRLAQMARATGIHLVVATQRPSTDVVTGLIKANFPSRISFTVASSIDSRVILDTNGAETLLGRGDMLWLNPETGTPLRAQGVLVTDQEVEKLIAHWQKILPEGEGATPQAAPWEELMTADDDNSDALIQRAITVVKGEQRASASLLQRRLRIGYPRAARLIDELEDLGVIGPSQGGGREREVLVSKDEDDETDNGSEDAE